MTSTEIALRFPKNQGFTGRDSTTANPAPTFTDEIAFAIRAYREGHLPLPNMLSILSDIEVWRDDRIYNGMTPRDRAMHMAKLMRNTRILVDIEWTIRNIESRVRCVYCNATMADLMPSHLCPDDTVYPGVQMICRNSHDCVTRIHNQFHGEFTCEECDMCNV